MPTPLKPIPSSLGILCLFTLLTLSGCGTLGAPQAGLIDDKLQPCPPTPNCVSSQASDAKHYVEPFEIQGEKDITWQQVVDTAAAMPRTRIVTQTHNYLHAEVISPWHVYTDDLELLWLEGQRLIHVRSSSRIGYYDFGVNRERVEYLKAKFRTHGWFKN